MESKLFVLCLTFASLPTNCTTKHTSVKTDHFEACHDRPFPHSDKTDHCEKLCLFVELPPSSFVFFTLSVSVHVSMCNSAAGRQLVASKGRSVIVSSNITLYKAAQCPPPLFVVGTSPFFHGSLL